MALPTKCNLCLSGIEQQNVLTTHVYGDLDNKYAFFKCNSCKVIYLFPQLSDTDEKKFYAKEFESFMDSRTGNNAGWDSPNNHIAANQNQFKRRFKYLKPLLVENCKILEFGCSSGFMLIPLVKQGYQCFGVEPSGYFSDFVRKNNIKIFDSYQEIEYKFDVVMHFFVLEHVKDPLSFINSNLDLLKPGGKLVIEIPNANDPLFTIYNIPAFEKFYWSLAHHWYFNEDAISYILDRIPNISFEILLDQRYDLSNHMVWARDSKPGGMGKFSEKIGIDLDDFYKQSLIKSGYCDTIILIITKEN